MRRHELSDEEWAKVEPLLPPQQGRPPERGDRHFVNAALWIAKTGAPWRQILRAAAVSDADLAGILDSTIVRAHQDAAGGRGGPKKTR